MTEATGDLVNATGKLIDMNSSSQDAEVALLTEAETAELGKLLDKAQVGTTKY